jgi:hypothetical protein
VTLFASQQSQRTTDDFLTPAWVFVALGLRFDVDVASPPWDTHVPADVVYTMADDGLSQPWFGRVWMNPPYSKPEPWVDRFIEHANGIALVPTSNGRWFGRLWMHAVGLVVPTNPVIFDGGGIPIRTIFAAFGDDCVKALRHIGRVR